MDLLARKTFCEICGSSLEVDMPSGFCPACLLATALDSPDVPASGSRIEDYELLNEIARGGMGIVYRARQRTPSRIVALKMILPVHLRSSGAVNRFRTEAEAAASLDHECILPIYSVGEQDGTPFYSMKFAEGGPLSVRIENYRTKPHETAALIAKLARAIAYAHERGILHRDLKPGNILFDGAGKPYVSDFGLAKWLQRECDLTQTLAILGTPFYMAPEQAADSRAVGSAADVYSLGAILYQMLTGHPPVSGETPMEVLRRAAEQAPRRPQPDESSCSPGSGDDLLKVSRERTGVALFLGRCAGRRSRTLLRRAHDPSPARWPNDPYVALDAAQSSHRGAGRRFGRARCFAVRNRLARAYSPAAKRPRRAAV